MGFEPAAFFIHSNPLDLVAHLAEHWTSKTNDTYCACVLVLRSFKMADARKTRRACALCVFSDQGRNSGRRVLPDGFLLKSVVLELI